jgi:hypothetical protein
LQQEIASLNSGAINPRYALEQTNKLSEEISQDARNASMARPKALELAQNLIRSGFLAPGKGISGREQLMSVAQTVSDIFGLGKIDPNLPATQISEKLITQAVGQQTAALGQHAQSALRMLAQGFANQNMSSTALQELLADVLVEGQKSIDLDAYNQKYRQEMASQYPGVGTRVRQAFENEYNEDFWLNEKKALIKMMQFPTAPKGANPANPSYSISAFQHVRGDPRSRSMTPKANPEGKTYQEIYNPAYVEKHYGPGIYRYFSGNVM